ncbi:MAG: hypothetical protein ACPLRA_07115, partial [Candidatus Saccharicenans sp.]
MSLEFLAELPEFKALVARLKKGEDCLFLSGIVAEARPYFYALLAREISRPLLIITPDASLLPEKKRETENFLRLLSISR